MALPKTWTLMRLTRSPELTFSGAGLAICKVGLAASEKYGDKETKLFIDVTAFKKTAEMLSTVQKGHRVYAFLKFSTDFWDDKETGKPRSKTVAILEQFEFIEPKQQDSNQSQFQQNQGQGFQSQQPTGGNAGFQGPPDDDIPFSPNMV